MTGATLKANPLGAANLAGERNQKSCSVLDHPQTPCRNGSLSYPCCSELQKSIAEYRACVDANAKRVKVCEAQRLSMEAEERAYYNPPAATSKVNIQSR